MVTSAARISHGCPASDFENSAASPANSPNDAGRHSDPRLDGPDLVHRVAKRCTRGEVEAHEIAGNLAPDARSQRRVVRVRVATAEIAPARQRHPAARWRRRGRRVFERIDGSR